jgi:hypothetical protein
MAALSNFEGSSSFLHVRNMPAYSGFRIRSYPTKPDIETVTVHTERLDHSLPAEYVPTLIKVDVEGAELLVLEGAIETLRRYQPTVIFEHGKGSAEFYGTTPSAIFHVLSDEAGLRIFNLDGGGPYNLNEFEETYNRNDYWNFVAHR